MEYLTKYWKTMAAIVYLTICILDFIVLPSYLMYYYSLSVRMGYYEKVEEIWGDHPEILKELTSRKGTDWSPYTLRGAGMFHLSFGAILTGAVLNGRRKKE